MNYNYRISEDVSRSSWIFVWCEDWDEPDGFMNLIEEIEKDCSGKIKAVGSGQFKIEGGKMDLTYQWDDLFGIVVIKNRFTQTKEVVNFLETYFRKLNV